jgi:hypothetical protein
MAGKPLIASFDAGVPLRDVQEAASRADPRTTMRYDETGCRWTGTPVRRCRSHRRSRPVAFSSPVPARTNSTGLSGVTAAPDGNLWYTAVSTTDSRPTGPDARESN